MSIRERERERENETKENNKKDGNSKSNKKHHTALFIKKEYESTGMLANQTTKLTPVVYE